MFQDGSKKTIWSTSWNEIYKLIASRQAALQVVQQTVETIMPTWISPANLHRSKGNSAYFDWPQPLASITPMSPNTQCTLTKHLKNTTRVNFKNHKYPYGAQAANPSSEQQFQAQELVSFASHLAISRTFNSLFKVLFTFPSRYSFAIGLATIFSFRRKFPPILRTTSKVRDSPETDRTSWTVDERRDSHPL